MENPFLNLDLKIKLNFCFQFWASSENKIGNLLFGFYENIVRKVRCCHLERKWTNGQQSIKHTPKVLEMKFQIIEYSEQAFYWFLLSMRTLVERHCAQLISIQYQFSSTVHSIHLTRPKSCTRRRIHKCAYSACYPLEWISRHIICFYYGIQWGFYI